MYAVNYSPQAIEDLGALAHKERQRIISKIEFFASTKNCLTFAKPLKNLGAATHRFRIGNYRILFFIKSDGSMGILEILRIRHRRHSY